MQKNNIRMIVQSIDENAKEFGKRIEDYCYEISLEFKEELNMPPIVFLTSAADGRQTATLQFITTVSDKTKDATFSGFHLRLAYSKFIQEKSLQTYETDQLYDFLLKEVMEDYVN